MFSQAALGGHAVWGLCEHEAPGSVEPEHLNPSERLRFSAAMGTEPRSGSTM